ncbi:hypothetical protein KFU94_56645 [Chloroflexi bacterium TSY]|nr:hypothetical protein [Chloroflexi bacterium TSY]
MQFFRHELGGGLRLRQEVFYLAYHLHWPWSEIMALDVSERWTYVQMLAQRIEAENQEFAEVSERLRRG